MTREIKFRGKATMPIVEMGEYGIRHNAGWVYGSYLDGYILSGVAVADTDYFSSEWWCWADPKTVGQYTGLKDKNGEAIYEGDIVLRVHSKYDPSWLEPEMLQIVWHPETASFVCADVHGVCCPMDEDEWRVVGNIHDNPELLGVEYNG